MFQGFKVLDPRLCVLGSWFLDPRSWVLHPGYWVSDYRSWSLGSRLLILNYVTFNGIGNPISLFHGKIGSLSFRFDELQSLISKFKNDFQLIGIQKPDLKIKIITFNISQLNQLILLMLLYILYIKKAIDYNLRPDLIIYGKW